MPLLVPLLVALGLLALAGGTVVVSSADWRARILAVVRGHESAGDGFAAINPNRDGAGLSFGILQWAQAPGGLGELLAAMHRADPGAFAQTFGPSWPQLLLLTSQPRAQDTPLEGAVLWREPWLSRFRAAAAVPAFQSVQLELATAGPYMRAAEEAAAILGLRTERALAFLLDRAVQQGGGRVVDLARRAAGPGSSREVLERVLELAAARFRSPHGPGARLASHIEWRQVGDEWHAFAGRVDLYVDILRRGRSILDSPRLSDQLVG